MEITFKITQAEYLRAVKLRKKPKSGAIVKTVMFWVLVLTCLTVLWTVFRPGATSSGRADATSAVVTQSDDATPESVPPGTELRRVITNFGPFVPIAAVWVYFVFLWVPIRLRRMYKRDPVMQGQFSMKFTPASLSIQNTAGISIEMGWNIVEYWREGKGLILLVFYPGTGYPVSLANLTDPQREELRSILTAALPKR
jgi:tellurite resistance protein TehA-like permease